MVETERGEGKSLQGSLKRTLGRKRMTQTTCGKRWQLAFKRWPQRCVEQLKGVEAKIKILDGRTRKSKGILRRKKIVHICTMIGVWTTWRST